MKFRFVLIALIASAMAGTKAQSPATVKEYEKLFTTYGFSDPNPIASFTKIYPYFRYDGFTDKPEQKQWKVVELSNDYIKLIILPEIGGKVWAAIEKSTGQPFIYYNHVIKFRDVAMRGPWTSGGLEANYGIIGHTPNCATPVDYTTSVNEDGSASCIIGVLDLLTRTNWRIEINLPRDRAYFTTKSFWYNSTPLEQPYYHWMNTGIKAKGNLEFIYPGTNYLGHEGEYSDWPVNKSNGKKISFYEENNFGGYKSYHVFGKYTDFFGAYWHDDDFGMARYAPHDDKAGKKIWIWGLSQQGMIWEKLLTDTDGQYVEVQSGRLFNQNAEKSTFTPFKHKSFSPYSTDQWTEYWYPVLHTRGFVEANNYGALNVIYEDGWLKVYFCPVETIRDSLIIKEGDRIVYSKQLVLSPLKTFADSIRINLYPQNLVTTLGKNKLIYQSDPGANVLSRPLESPKDFDWQSAYGLYMQGREFADQKMYPAAEEKLQEALNKDPNFLPALVKMSELLYRNLLYLPSLQLSKKALSIDTHDGAANYFYGLANEQLGNTVDAKDGFDLATLSEAYRSAAYIELGKIYLREKNWEQAISYAQKALDFNRYNMAAYELQAIAYRNQNDTFHLAQVLNTMLSFDKLNHFVRSEHYLLQPSDVNEKQLVSNIQNEQPFETFLELATNYFNNGCLDDAEKILRLSPSNMLVNYWLAYIENKKGKNFSESLKKANQSSPAFIFPFRSETEQVLQWAARQTPGWKPHYLLALLYKDRNRVREADSLMRQLANTPDYAPFYASRALLVWNDDQEQTRADLTKAIALDKEEWRYPKLLAEFELEQQQYDKALDITERYYRSHPQNYIIGMLYAKALLGNKQYAKTDALLSHLNIIPFEGATEGRELYREAKLMEAVQAYKAQAFKKALDFVDAARKWPENLGVGKPYESDVDERLEDWICYLCYQKTDNEPKAKNLLQKITDFHPQRENTVRNFIAANNLVTAWAIEKLKDREEAVNWLDQQAKMYPGDEILQWTETVFNGNRTELPGIKKDASVRVLDAILGFK